MNASEFKAKVKQHSQPLEFENWGFLLGFVPENYFNLFLKTRSSNASIPWAVSLIYELAMRDNINIFENCELSAQAKIEDLIKAIEN